MAVHGSESEVLLNETLTALQTTSKGRLSYDTDWKINAEFSNQLSCSFESFLNESWDSLGGINTSLLGLEENNSDTSSENEAESSLMTELNDTAKEPNNAVGISVNFESENEHSIKQYNDDCRGNAEQRKAEQARTLKRRMKNLKIECEQTLRNKEENLAEKKRQFEIEIKELQRQDAEELRRRKVELYKEAMAYKQRLDEIFTRSLTEESLVAREREQQIAVLENLKKNVTLLYQQVLRNIELIQQKFANSKHMSFVDAQVAEDIATVLDRIPLKAEAELSKCEASHDISDVEDHLEFMRKLIQATLSIDNKVGHILKLAQEKAMAAAKKRESEEAERIKFEEAKQQEQVKQQQEQAKKLEANKKLSEKLSVPKNEERLPIATPQTSKKESKTTTAQKFIEYISDKALIEYMELQEHLNTVQASFKGFISDSKYTKYKFDLQKAVNIPINALSAHSPSQLNDKIHRLVSLLSGNNVEVGGRRVNCKTHPSAMVFCKDLVAKKLVMQGAQQVSSNPQSAFLYAAVIVGIWTAFPDVGKLILAHFHRSYPYLVPYYIPQVEGQSNNDYHKALGYSVNNDKIEDENHFLKKFSGTVQLYAAVVSSKGAATPDHPHGIDKGWTWLARTLNLKPHPSVTATMLFEFIKVAGHLLMERYRKQFQKLLLMLYKDFIPAMDKVTPPEKQGPMQRFKDFLDECVKTQKIPMPKGYLTERWWHSGHF
ncbi:nucleoporin GLE1-like [Paramuricea clavata]|uniref:mRNA export factor GLE1 n=1 Tax=Paramuricea clavata TaxID=317549 RepID=A0A6S7K0B1_PARCT|nr:nucleoporin GLE1-like [Paramuricea clavata]